MTKYTHTPGDMRRATELRMTDWQDRSPAEIYMKHYRMKDARRTRRQAASVMVFCAVVFAIWAYAVIGGAA